MTDKHENIVDRFEKKTHAKQIYTSTNSSSKTSGDPINILLIDGGGSKGLASVPMLQAIQEHYVEEGKDLLGQFDLVGGTSVGGLSCLLISYYKGMGMSTASVCAKMKDVGDLIREKCFSKISFLNLLCCNNLIKGTDSSVVNVLKDDYEKPLRSDSYVPAMVCIASVKDNEGDMDLNNDNVDVREFEPFVARTYEYPESSKRNISDALAKSSSDMMMHEAMAATSAVPLLVDRVRVKVESKLKVMADGMMFQSCPISLCLDQAEKLYPGRSIGTILNLGFGTDEVELIERTVKAAREVHPNIQFQRVCPSHIMNKFSPAETSTKKINQMEVDVKDW
eukprot:CAMPEP_0194090652 /NCGR_PEP_ID=MMETSP0149-20130528/39979_1 /TAXON_ID=122233 /ORGANISM="Chaetoceros debilis, Strain MM31A-1" /LENGTH=336 /DNA_ID=CAMNT_0038774975 /DNA_START=55 /DNA_END=1062 /DNA_ORIENTATION=-